MSAIANYSMVDELTKRAVGYQVPLFFLILTLFSGNYTLNRVVILPFVVEFKYLFAIATILTTIVSMAKYPRIARTDYVSTLYFLFSVFLLLYVSSAFWVTYNPYTISAIVDIFWIFFFASFGTLLGSRLSGQEIIFSAKVFVGIGLLFAVAGLISSPSGQGRISAFGGGPNVYVRIVVIGFIFTVYLYVKTRIKIYLFWTLPLLMAAFLSGSRGGIIALLGVSVFVLFIHFNRPRDLMKLFFVAVLFTLLASIYFRFNPDIWIWVKARYIDTLLGEKVYTSGRDSLYELGIDIFQLKPILGNGISAYASYVDGGYPHNLFIEVATSIGLIGLLILALFVFLAFLLFFRHWRQEIDVLVFFVGFVYILIASQFSGSFFDTRFAWTFVFLAFGVIDLTEENGIAHNVYTGGKLEVKDGK